jgi:hypothetical protein
MADLVAVLHIQELVVVATPHLPLHHKEMLVVLALVQTNLVVAVELLIQVELGLHQLVAMVGLEQHLLYLV